MTATAQRQRVTPTALPIPAETVAAIRTRYGLSPSAEITLLITPEPTDPRTFYDATHPDDAALLRRLEAAVAEGHRCAWFRAACVIRDGEAEGRAYRACGHLDTFEALLRPLATSFLVEEAAAAVAASAATHRTRHRTTHEPRSRRRP